MRSRKDALGIAILSFVVITFGGVSCSSEEPMNTQGSELPIVTVYKSPTCGCCEKWGDHLKQNGFKVLLQDEENVTKIKKELSVPTELTSCHTALVDGYVIEGHVPAEDVKRLLEERPDVVGLTVPGMPVGSPGMEVEGGHKVAYEVLSFDASGKTDVFSRH